MEDVPKNDNDEFVSHCERMTNSNQASKLFQSLVVICPDSLSWANDTSS